MDDSRCVEFLQWALPQLRMRWQGFRKVRKQVCKRLQRRIRQLGLDDIDAYRRYLQDHRDEWAALDPICRVTVSRFYRDRVVLQHLGEEVLPVLSRAVVSEGSTVLQGWCAGCASGEEAYSLVLMWEMQLAKAFPALDIEVVGTDIDDTLLERAGQACYAYGSVKALPSAWLQSAFSQQDDRYCLEPRFRDKACFISRDIRKRGSEGPFHIVFCRNLAFTYYEHALQLEVLAQLHDQLLDGGVLVIGGHETLPEGFTGFEPWPSQRAIFRKCVR